MNPNKAYQAVDNLIEGMDAAEQSQLFEHLRASYPEQLGPVAVNGAAATVETNQSVGLTPEQQEKATKLTAAMAEKFSVATEDFSVLKTTAEDGSDRYTVAYTAGNGVDLGNSRKDYDSKRSWNSIFDKKNDKNFQVTVGRKKHDARTGMTRDVYDAFIADTKARGVSPLPDSPQLSEANGEAWTDTWMTGEEAGRLDAPIAFVGWGGQVVHDRYHRDRAFRGSRFRPAVVVE